jgi:hypothetical protein
MENTDHDEWECPGYHLTYSANKNGIYLYTAFFDKDNLRYKLIGDQRSNDTTLISYDPPSGSKYRRGMYSQEWYIPKYVPLVLNANGVAQIESMINKLSKLIIFS